MFGKTNENPISENEKNEQKISQQTQELLLQSKEILKSLAKRFGENDEKYLAAQKEYDDVIEAHNKALKDDQKITEQELAIIELEFINLLKLEGGESKVTSFLNTAGTIARNIPGLNLDSSNVAFLGDSVKLTNQHQDDLIVKIFGNEKRYNDEYLHGFNNAIGNHVISISDFKKELKTKNILDINSHAFANYILYLNDKGKLNQKELIDNFGLQNLIDLEILWNNPDVSGIAKKTVENQGINITEIISTCKFLKSPTDFLNSIDKISGKIAEENGEEYMLLLGNLFEVHGEDIEANFGKILTQQIKQKNPELSDQKIKEILQAFGEQINNYKGDYSKLPEIYIAFGELSKTYNLGLNIEDSVQNLLISHTANISKKISELQEKQQKIKKDLEDIPNEMRILAQNLPYLYGEEKERSLEKLIGLSQQTSLNTSEYNKNNQDIERLTIEVEGTLLTTQIHNNIDDDARAKIISSLSLQEAKEIFQIEINTIKESNQEIKTAIEKYEQKRTEYEKKYPSIEKDKKAENEKQNTSQDNQTFLSNNSLILRTKEIKLNPTTNGNFSLDTGNSKIEITSTELKIVENNEKALENLINFKETLDELGISKLWDFREKIFSSLKNKAGNTFDEKDDYLKKSEVCKFLNTTLLSIGAIKEIPNNSNLTLLKEEFKIKNKVGAILNGGINQINGNTSIEQAFINNFCPIENNGQFKTGAFREAIA